MYLSKSTKHRPAHFQLPKHMHILHSILLLHLFLNKDLNVKYSKGWNKCFIILYLYYILHMLNITNI